MVWEATGVDRGQTACSFMSHVIAVVVLRRFPGVMDSVEWFTKGTGGGGILPQCSWSHALKCVTFMN